MQCRCQGQSVAAKRIAMIRALTSTKGKVKKSKYLLLQDAYNELNIENCQLKYEILRLSKMT